VRLDLDVLAVHLDVLAVHLDDAAEHGWTVHSQARPPLTALIDAADDLLQLARLGQAYVDWRAAAATSDGSADADDRVNVKRAARDAAYHKVREAA
jgi:hypothetical protein